ncbi:MAG TPA: LysM domain-containing protein [Dermatophilaceae bacterium]|nr:LysM domain-containing protein [Dermatophilaceae bacterium]
MSSQRRHAIVRSCAGAAFGAASSASITWALGSVTVAAWADLVRPATTAPDDVLVVAAAACATLIAAWLGLSTTVSFLAALPGAVGDLSQRLSGRVAPRAVRRIVAIALGGTLVATAPGLAVAAPTDSGGVAALATRHTLVTSAVPDLDPHFLAVDSPGPLDPHFVTTDRASGPPQASPPGSAPTGAYVVRRGDSLWHIAARELPAGATTAQITTRWQQWYAANRATIGPDPDRLEVGQQLVAPVAVAR